MLFIIPKSWPTLETDAPVYVKIGEELLRVRSARLNGSLLELSGDGEGTLPLWELEALNTSNIGCVIFEHAQRAARCVSTHTQKIDGRVSLVLYGEAMA